jgi:hypothetical protein
VRGVTPTSLGAPLKGTGQVLMRINEWRETLQLQWSGEFKRFAPDDLLPVSILAAQPWRNAGQDGGRQGEQQNGSRAIS